MIDKELLDILACPACKADVRLEGDRIVCVKCAQALPDKGRYPDHAYRRGRDARRRKERGMTCRRYW